MQVGFGRYISLFVSFILLCSYNCLVYLMLINKNKMRVRIMNNQQRVCWWYVFWEGIICFFEKFLKGVIFSLFALV